jgi:hypothetical protein
MKNMKWFLLAAAVVAGLGLAAWWRQARSVENALLAETPYRVLKQHEPASYRAVLEAYRRMNAGKDSRATFVRAANQQFNDASTRRFPSASPGSVLALMNATLPVVDSLRARSAEACFAFWFPEVPGIPDVGQFISADDQRRLLELQGEVIRSSAEQPTPVPTSAEVDAPLSKIIDEMYRRYGADVQMLSKVEDPDIDRAKACAMTTSLYESIMALPPEVSGTLLRGLIGRGDGSGG